MSSLTACVMSYSDIVNGVTQTYYRGQHPVVYSPRCAFVCWADIDVIRHGESMIQPHASAVNLLRLGAGSCVSVRGMQVCSIIMF